MRLNPARIPTARHRFMLLALAANLLLACGDKGSSDDAASGETDSGGEGDGGGEDGGGGDGATAYCRKIVLNTPEPDAAGVALDAGIMVAHDGRYGDSTFFILTEHASIDTIEINEQLASLEWVEELGEEAYVDRATPLNKLTPGTTYQIEWYESSERCGEFTPWEFTTAAE